ncbi:MAG: hypothetical protein ACYTGK_17335, partial [Planctomycetota bacterium]
TATPAFTDRVLVRARRARRGRIVGLMAPLAAAAAVLLAVLLAPATEVSGPIDTEIVGYAWEADGETFGSLSPQDLEAEILEELDAT